MTARSSKKPERQERKGGSQPQEKRGAGQDSFMLRIAKAIAISIVVREAGEWVESLYSDVEVEPEEGTKDKGGEKR